MNFNKMCMYTVFFHVNEKQWVKVGRHGHDFCVDKDQSQSMFILFYFIFMSIKCSDQKKVRKKLAEVQLSRSKINQQYPQKVSNVLFAFDSRVCIARNVAFPGPTLYIKPARQSGRPHPTMCYGSIKLRGPRWTQEHSLLCASHGALYQYYIYENLEGHLLITTMVASTILSSFNYSRTFICNTTALFHTQASIGLLLNKCFPHDKTLHYVSI